MWWTVPVLPDIRWSESLQPLRSNAMTASAAAVIALGLLGFAGVAKVVDPDPTTGAINAAGVATGNLVSRVLGAIEVCAALAGLIVGSVAAAPAAILYLGFTVFTFLAVRRAIPVQSCGCFGREDTPPSRIHVVYNLCATASLVWLVLDRTQPIPWSSPTVEVMTYLGYAGLGGFLSYLLLAKLPANLKSVGQR